MLQARVSTINPGSTANRHTTYLISIQSAHPFESLRYFESISISRLDDVRTILETLIIPRCDHYTMSLFDNIFVHLRQLQEVDKSINLNVTPLLDLPQPNGGVLGRRNVLQIFMH